MKADEYSKDEPLGHYDGMRAMLLCRVVLGWEGVAFAFLLHYVSCLHAVLDLFGVIVAWVCRQVSLHTGSGAGGREQVQSWRVRQCRSCTQLQLIQLAFPVLSLALHKGTLGDRAKSVGTFREVAIYDPDQVRTVVQRNKLPRCIQSTWCYTSACMARS